MTTIDFFNSVVNWLSSDVSHVVVLASALAALTPTPAPGTTAGKLYKIIDLFALNFMHAKSTGVTVDSVAEQVAVLLEQKKAASTTPATKEPS